MGDPGDTAGDPSGRPDLAEGTTVVLADDQVSSELDGERVILELDSGTYYGVNEVGARVWELIEDPQTVGEVRDLIAAEFDTTPEECGPDVRSFLSDLRSAGLVEVREGE